MFWTNSSDEVAFEKYVSGTFSGLEHFTNVSTDLGPAATTFAGVSNSGKVLSTVVAWKAQTTNELYYTVQVGSSGSWGTITNIPQALTKNTPAIASLAKWGADPGELTLYAGWSGQSAGGLYYSASNTP